MTMVVDRDYASNHELGFAQNPMNLGDSSYVNMYLHHDGYPEWQGVQLANWINHLSKITFGNYNRHKFPISDGAKVASRLVRDHYYDSCYLYNHPEAIDHQYTYVIWTGDGDDIWISCYDQYSSRCVFVLKPDKIIDKYKDDMEYTDWKNGETRLNQVENYTI
tara:strand:+ start:49 stop:537 length:489 start_codon:yes stop_codon:yes gene_type:complete